MLAFGEGDEKLTPIAVRTTIGHAENSSFMMSELGMKLICKFRTKYTLTPVSRSARVSTLDAEIFN